MGGLDLRSGGGEGGGVGPSSADTASHSACPLACVARQRGVRVVVRLITKDENRSPQPRRLTSRSSAWRCEVCVWNRCVLTCGEEGGRAVVSVCMQVCVWNRCVLTWMPGAAAAGAVVSTC